MIAIDESAQAAQEWNRTEDDAMTRCTVCGRRPDDCHWASEPHEIEAAERLIAAGAEVRMYLCRDDGSCGGHDQVVCPACGGLLTISSDCGATMP